MTRVERLFGHVGVGWFCVATTKPNSLVGALALVSRFFFVMYWAALEVVQRVECNVAVERQSDNKG